MAARSVTCEGLGGAGVPSAGGGRGAALVGGEWDGSCRWWGGRGVRGSYWFRAMQCDAMRCRAVVRCVLCVEGGELTVVVALPPAVRVRA